MKRVALTICLVVAFLSGGCNYVGVTGGGTSFAIEFESPPPDKPKPKPGERDLMLTGGFTVIDSDLKTRWSRVDPEMGGFIKFGWEVMPDTGFFINFLGGATWCRYTKVYKTVERRGLEELEWYELFGGGITYVINDEDFCLTTAYDNRRGFTLGAGWRF